MFTTGEPTFTLRPRHQGYAGNKVTGGASMEKNCKEVCAPGLVDSTLKLHLLLLFYQHAWLWGDARRLSEWLHVDPWSVAEELEALAESGFLIRGESQGPITYHLGPLRGHQRMLQ